MNTHEMPQQPPGAPMSPDEEVIAHLNALHGKPPEVLPRNFDKLAEGELNDVEEAAADETFH